MFIEVLAMYVLVGRERARFLWFCWYSNIDIIVRGRSTEKRCECEREREIEREGEREGGGERERETVENHMQVHQEIYT